MKTHLTIALFAVSAYAQNLPQPASGNVTLPLEEFNRLSELAAHQAKPEAIPFPHVLKSAQLNLRVNPTSVTGAVEIEGEVFARGDRSVPLVTNMIVLDAQQRGKELPLEQVNKVHSALLTGPAQFTANLEVAVPLAIEAGRASFDLAVPEAGAVRLTLSVPGDQTDVNLTPGIITERSSHNGQTTIEATLVPGQTANLSWASRLNATVAPAVPKEVRFLSEIKSLISVSDAELSVAALAQITVVQGEPTEFRVQAPDGFELTGATGATLLFSEFRDHKVMLKVLDPSVRAHEFLLTFSKTNANIAKVDLPLVTFLGTQRETGEVLVESDGAMELNASAEGGVRRMDLKETSPELRLLSRATLQAAFRYQKRPSESQGLALNWVRFSDSRVAAAVAQRAEVTTLATSEGRSLTEIKLTLKNQSQPFLKVELPAGASILYSAVAGQSVKPVQGADGSRVPLLRAGFRPSGDYVVSFVMLNPDAAFNKKGNAALALPKMDVPIAQLNWEVFLPQQLKVGGFAGDVAPAHLFPVGDESVASAVYETNAISAAGGTGVLTGLVTDESGAVVPQANVTVTQGSRTFTAVANQEGRWSIQGVPSGPITVTVEVTGFRTAARRLNYDSNRPSDVVQALSVGSTNDVVHVEAATAQINFDAAPENQQRDLRQNAAPPDTAASANVTDLQKKVVGVLPISIQIPRTGNSYRFVRTLVVDEETKLSFAYRGH